MSRPIDAVQVLNDINWHHKPNPVSDFESGFNNGLNQAMWIITHAPTLTPPPITGDTSDGYHTFNELYHHRAILFSVICNERPEVAWKSKRHHDGTMYDGMFIVGISTPEGQATYHYDIEPYWSMFHVKELEYAPEWDGHTPDEAIRRIGTLPPPNEPLPVLVNDEPDREFIDYICPRCKDTISQRRRGQRMETVYQCKYHDNCGQRVDWENPQPYRRPPEGEEDT